MHPPLQIDHFRPTGKLAASEGPKSEEASPHLYSGVQISLLSSSRRKICATLIQLASSIVQKMMGGLRKVCCLQEEAQFPASRSVVGLGGAHWIF